MNIPVIKPRVLCEECGCEVVKGRCKNPECACHWKSIVVDKDRPVYKHRAAHA